MIGLYRGKRLFAGRLFAGRLFGSTGAPDVPATGGGSWHSPPGWRRHKRRDDESVIARRPASQPTSAADLAEQMSSALRAIGSPADLVKQWNLDALRRELLALRARQDAAILAAAQALHADQQRLLTNDELALLLLLSW